MLSRPLLFRLAVVTCCCSILAFTSAVMADNVAVVRVLSPDQTLLPDATVAFQNNGGEFVNLVPLSDGTFVVDPAPKGLVLDVTHAQFGSAQVSTELPAPMSTVFVYLNGRVGNVKVVEGRIAPQQIAAGVVADLQAVATPVEHNLSATTDIPTGGNPACGAGAGDCCASGGNGTPGCDDETCCNLVCDIDPFCCDTSWDGICAGEAADLCGDLCGGPPGGCMPECPEGALEEPEACGSDANGGCNSTPPIFTDSGCSDTWCGTAWADGGMRDTDWYLVNHGGGGDVTGALTSAFNGVVFIVDGIGACAPAVVGTTGDSNNCVPGVTASATLAAGQYVVFVATADFDGAPCGGENNNYTLTVGCVAGGEPECGNGVCEPGEDDVNCPEDCADMGVCGPGNGDCCADGGNGTPGCNDAECCDLVCGIDPFCCDTSWDGICAGEAQDLCAVCNEPECMSDADCPAGQICVDGLCVVPGGCPECPEGGLEEPEACGDDTNGGCNSTPVAFTDAACGDLFCGTGWATGGMRDTDWYLVDHTGGTLGSTLNSAFPGVNFIVDGIAACAPAVVGDIGCADGCMPIADASAELAAGQYVVFVAAGDCAGGGVFEGFPCGGSNDYTLSINCEGGCQSDDDCAPGEVCIDGVCIPPPPANDDCENAEPLEVGPGGEANVDGSTEQATADAGVPDCGTTITAPGVWYSVIGTGNTMTASTCDQADYDTKINIYCGDCPAGGGPASDCCEANGTPGCDDPECEALICGQDPFCCDIEWDSLCADAANMQCEVCQSEGGLTCVDGQDDNPACGGFTTELSWCTQPGAEYLILVQGFGGATGNFTLTVSDNNAGCTPTVQCLVLGACCLPDGTCLDSLTEEACAAEEGVFQGDGTTCQGGFEGYSVEACENPFFDISQTGTLAPTASSTDDGGDVVGISFNFNFFGDNHNTIGIASNGYITFGSDLSDFTNDPIPDTLDPNDYIGPLWDDWSPNQAGDVYYQEFAAPDRVMVQWDGVPHFSSGGSSTFQAILFADGAIEYRYADFLLDSPTVGVENQDGTDGTSVATPAPGDCVRIIPSFGDPIECPIAATQETLIIKQGACPAPVNLGSNGVIPMVLVGTDAFDVSQVDTSTLSLSLCGGDEGIAPIDGPPGPMIQILDLNHAEEPVVTCDSEGCACNENQSSDGIDDLELKFSTDALAGLVGDVSGVVKLELSGSLNNGDMFLAVDCIAVVPPGQGAVNASVDTNTPDAFIDFQPFDLNWDTGGFGNFSRTFVSATSVTITADMMSPDGRQFFRWIIDGVPQPVGLNSMTVNLADNMPLRAIYGRHKNLGEQAPDVPF